MQDNLGSVRDVIDNAGNVINRIDYDAFGNILAITNPSDNDAELTSAATRFLFTGQEWDGDVALHYYNARWYDPLTGTFISKDPLNFAAGDANLYRYVGNDPTNFVDPSGHDLVPWNPESDSHAPRPQPDGNPPPPNKPPGGGPWDNFGNDYWKYLNPLTGDGDACDVLFIPGKCLGWTAAVAGSIGAACCTATGSAVIVTFRHGARHLAGTGLSEAAVEAAIASKLARDGSFGHHWGWVQVAGQWVQYRVFVLQNGTVNCGTYFPTEGPLKK